MNLWFFFQVLVPLLLEYYCGDVMDQVIFECSNQGRYMGRYWYHPRYAHHNKDRPGHRFRLTCEPSICHGCQVKFFGRVLTKVIQHELHGLSKWKIHHCQTSSMRPDQHPHPWLAQICCLCPLHGSRAAPPCGLHAGWEAKFQRGQPCWAQYSDWIPQQPGEESCSSCSRGFGWKLFAILFHQIPM